MLIKFIAHTFITWNAPRYSMALGETLKCSAYHPLINGLAERTVQTLKEALKKTTGDMEMHLARFLFQYRITPHTTTGCSPAELLLGRKPRTHLDLIHPESSGSTPQLAKAPPVAVQTRVAQSQHRQKEGHVRRAKTTQLHCGPECLREKLLGSPVMASGICHWHPRPPDLCGGCGWREVPPAACRPCTHTI